MQIKQTKSFERELKKLVKKHFPIAVLKPCLEAIVEQDVLVLKQIKDHALKGNWRGYREFHLRDTPKNKTPSETNDVLVVYTIDKDELVLTGILVGSHDRLFPGQNRAKRYRKSDE